LKPGYLLVVCLQFVIGDETLIQYCHPGHHRLLRLVLCPIQFHQICGSSGPHRCSHRSDELSLFVVVHLVPPQVHYTPWSVRSFFSISKNNTFRSVHSVHLTHQTLVRKSRTRTQPPYHITHLTQPDAAPNSQDAPDAAPNTQDAT